MTEQHAHDRLAPPTIATRRILLVAGGCLAFLAATFAVLGFVYVSAVPRQPIPAPRTFPAPRLQPGEAAELSHLLTKQREQLNLYRWANSERTLVAIPIERAMKLIAQRGADGYAPIAAQPGAAAPETGARP